MLFPALPMPMTYEQEKAWLNQRIANLKELRDNANFEIKELEARVRTLLYRKPHRPSKLNPPSCAP